MHKPPPSWANRFLQWYCASHLVDEIQGDLHEAHYHRQKELGTTKAAIWFVWDVIRFFRPASFAKYQKNSNQYTMVRDYIKLGFRIFKRNKIYSTINLSGLVLGVACCLLILLHVIQEASYDNFHPDTANTYRVVMDMYNQNELSTRSAPVYPAVGPGLREDLPEIVDFVRILPFGDGVYSVKDENGQLIRFNEERAVFADANFFSLFGFELVGGSPDEVLNKPNQIVLSETAAKRYFGDSNPLGKNITFRGENTLLVTGVMKDFPEKSHMQFDMITSLKTNDDFESWPQNWGWYDFYTYIRVDPNVRESELSKKLQSFLSEKKAEVNERTGSKQQLWVQNVADIHLYSEGMSWDMGDNGGSQQVYFLSAIAILILIIAWVNFVNLSTARAVKRGKEVGIRKVVGVGKGQLITQFLMEAFLYNFFGVFFAVVLVLIAIPFIASSIELSIDPYLLLTSEVLFGIAILIFGGSLLSGIYPAFVLTSFKPISVLRGSFYSRKSSFGFRQMLVIFQFTVSIVLILGTILVIKQLRFMQNQSLGLNVEQTLVVNGPSSSRGDGDLTNRQELFRTKLEQSAEVKGFTVSSNIPGEENFWISGFTTRQSEGNFLSCYVVSIDDKFFDQFEIDLVAGRNVSRDLRTDTTSVVLNMEAIKLFGYSSPEAAIGEILNPGRAREWKIVGVVDNYHQASLREALDPMAFFLNRGASEFFSLKLNSNDYSTTVASIESTWNEIYPDNPFDFFFLDEFFNRQYQSDIQFNAVFISFAFLAIFVACLGLFGLVSFTVEQAKKEIGIRKVLGATVSKIMLLLAKDYAKLILTAFLVAYPLSFWLMKKWLQSFAYQTSIGIGIFLLGGLFVLIVAFLTVSSKSYNVSKTNPVSALRDE
ncbi:MAG: ABC transporter permease [Cyclobacteriaceae bacterium]